MNQATYEDKNVKSDEFWTLWQAHQARLRMLCMRWLQGDLAKIDDAMSQARDKAYNYYLEATEAFRSFSAWVSTLTKNICTDIHRDNDRQLKLCKTVSHSPELFYFSNTSSTPLEESVQLTNTLEDVSSAFQKLPNDLKLPMHYRFVEDMEYSEIADLLQITPANVRKRIQLARKKLREAIQ